MNNGGQVEPLNLIYEIFVLKNFLLAEKAFVTHRNFTNCKMNFVSHMEEGLTQ